MTRWKVSPSAIGARRIVLAFGTAAAAVAIGRTVGRITDVTPLSSGRLVADTERGALVRATST